MKYKQYYVQALKGILLLCLFSPLVVSLESYIFPFVVPKVLFFRTLVSSGFLLFLFLLWNRTLTVSWRKPLVISTGVFLLVAFLSAVFGVDWHHSWWGSFERMEGVFTLIHLYAFFVMLFTVFHAKKDWYLILHTLLVVCLLVFGAGVLQFFSSAKHPFLSLGGGYRAYGTLGNFIYFGQFSFVLFWLSILLAVSYAKNWKWHIGYGLTALCGVLGLSLAGSRGPMLAWLVSLLFFGFLSAVYSKSKKIKQIGLGSAGIIVLLLLTVIFFDVPGLSSIPGVDGLQQIATRTGTASTRLMAWEIAWKGFLDRPLLGWGWSNYDVVFNQYYNTEFLKFGFGETWFDHSHNQYFDLLSNTGIIGFLSYLSIFITLFLTLFGKKRSEISWKEFSLASLFVAYLVNNFFVFDHPSSYLIIFLFLAYVLVHYSPTDENGNDRAFDTHTLKKSMHRLTLLVLFLFTVYALWYGNILPNKLNRADRNAQVTFIEDPVSGMERMRHVMIMPSPYMRDVRNDFSSAILRLDRVQPGSGDFKIYLSLLQFGVETQKVLLEQHPFDLRARVRLIELYRELQTAEVDVLDVMEEELTEALRLSPERQQIYYLWSEALLFEDKFVEAREMVQKTIDENPSIHNGYWAMAKIYAAEGDWSTAKEYVTMALNRGFHPTETQIYLMSIIDDNL
ncbi:MAG: O-antigen ligase family protein [Candidatus Magasanikbacteria bacterium]